MKIKKPINVLFLWPFVIFLSHSLIQDFSWSQTSKDMLDDYFNLILVKEDGKGRIDMACSKFPRDELKCEIFETQISFPEDLFTTKFEKDMQKLKNMTEHMSDSELYAEYSKTLETSDGKFCKEFSFLDDLKNNSTVDQATPWIPRIRDLCANEPKSKESVRKWMLQLFAELESVPVGKTHDTCGIFTKQQNLSFQNLGNGKWSYTLKDNWGPLCPFVKYYELTMGENKGTWTLTETLLTLNSKSNACKRKEEELLKPLRWSSKTSRTINLPCEKVDWNKLSLD